MQTSDLQLRTHEAQKPNPKPNLQLCTREAEDQTQNPNHEESNV